MKIMVRGDSILVNRHILVIVNIVATIIKKVIGTGPDVGNHMHNLIATGNLTSKSGLGLQQVCVYCCDMDLIYQTILIEQSLEGILLVCVYECVRVTISALSFVVLIKYTLYSFFFFKYASYFQHQHWSSYTHNMCLC